MLYFVCFYYTQLLNFILLLSMICILLSCTEFLIIKSTLISTLLLDQGSITINRLKCRNTYEVVSVTLEDTRRAKGPLNFNSFTGSPLFRVIDYITRWTRGPPGRSWMKLKKKMRSYNVARIRSCSDDECAFWAVASARLCFSFVNELPSFSCWHRRYFTHFYRCSIGRKRNICPALDKRI